MSEKPEWFQITEDEQSTLEPKAEKRNLFKILAVSLPLVIAGAVLVGATGEADDDENAPAINTTIPSSTSSNTSNASTESSNTDAGSNSAIVVSTITTSKSAGVSNPAAPNSNAPSVGKVGVGVPMPTGKGDDDGREGHREREGHKKSENHESGEHAFGGDDD